MMRKMLFMMCALCLALSTGLTALAQEKQEKEARSGPPKVLQIFREEVKPGKAAAHEKVEVGWPRAFTNAKWPTHYLAVSSVTGPTEAWFLNGFDSLAAWEKDRQATEKVSALQGELDRLSQVDGELLSNTRSIAANYRDDLSYRASDIKIGQARYFYLTTIRIRPGYENDLIEANKLIREAHEKANIEENWAVFQVTLGMPVGTYLIFQPIKSLAEIDAFSQTHGKAFQDAIGDEGRKRLREIERAGTISRETNVFAFSPKMSYVSEEIASADPDFWRPKAKAVPVAKKEPKAAGSQQ